MENIFLFCLIVILFVAALVNYTYSVRYRQDLELLEKAHTKLIEVAKNDDDIIRALQRELSTGIVTKISDESPKRYNKSLTLFVFLPNENNTTQNLGDPEEIYVLAGDAAEACSFVDTEQWYLSKECQDKGIIMTKRRSVL